MDEKQIRKIVKEEILRSQKMSRFDGVSSVVNHAHTGLDSPKIKAEDVIPSTSVTGNVSFASIQKYRLNLNASFTPQSIQINGIATGTYAGLQTRVILVGSAQLTSTFYFQPSTTASVVTGNIEFPFNNKPAQSGSYLSVTRGGTANFFAGITEDHLVSVGFPSPTDIGDIKARVTVTDFSRNFIEIDVPYLQGGWEVTLNFVIT